jgi:hypothetical protein
MGGGVMVVREIPEQPYRVGSVQKSDGAGGPVGAPNERNSPAAPSAESAADAIAPSIADEPDVDAIEALGEAIVSNEALAEALGQRSLMMIAEFDRLRGWELAGHPSCAHFHGKRCQGPCFALRSMGMTSNVRIRRRRASVVVAVP